LRERADLRRRLHAGGVFEVGDLHAATNPRDFSEELFRMTLTPDRHLWTLLRSTSCRPSNPTRDLAAARLRAIVRALNPNARLAMTFHDKRLLVHKTADLQEQEPCQVLRNA
jgi:hypothetical protein